MSDSKYWVDEIMNALEATTPVRADENFVLNMEEFALRSIGANKVVPLPWMIAVAASFLILLSANIIIFRSSINVSSKNNNNTAYSDYEQSMYLIPTKFIEYE